MFIGWRCNAFLQISDIFSQQTIQTKFYSEKDHIIRSGMECYLHIFTGSAHIKGESLQEYEP